MNRSKTILLSLALAASTGLAIGCNKTADEAEPAPVEAKADEAKESADAPKDGELPIEATGPVAVVNGKTVSADKYNEAIRETVGMMPGQPMPAQLAAMMKVRTLDRLIDMELIDTALAEAGVKVSDAEIDAELAKFKERLPSEEAYQTFLTRRGLTEAKLKENIGKDFQLREVLKKKYNFDVTEQKAREFYQANEPRFEHEAQVHARHILIKVEEGADDAAVADAKKRAEEIAKLAKAPGADFEALAKEKSEGPAGPRGGDLGYFTKDRMVPEFANAAFSMKPGEVSEPVRSSFGFHVIQVVDTKAAGKTSFEEAKEEIIEQLEREEFRGAMTKFLEELKKDAKVERNEDNIRINVKEDAANALQGFPGMPPQLQMAPPQPAPQGEGTEEKAGDEAPTELKLNPPKLGN